MWKGIALVLCVPTMALAQRDWVRVHPTASPSAREYPATTFDEGRGVGLLFGGWTPSGQVNDTWTFDGQTWTRRHANQGPGVRFGSAMTYDAARDRVVLFGGSLLVFFLLSFQDTWEWNGSAWVNVTPPAGNPAPPAHPYPRMTYDRTRQVSVLVTYFGETWEWNGALWTRRVDAPIACDSCAFLSYDHANGVVLLVTGSETWGWDGVAWTRRTPSRTPPAVTGVHGGSSPGCRLVTLFGGSLSSSSIDETWEWDGNDWTQIATATRPPARHAHGAFHDPNRQELVVFGGRTSGGWLADTWTLSYASPPRILGHPMDVSACEGSRATFSVVAEGCAPLTYQWRRDGVALPGATQATLSIPSVRGGDAGRYDVVVSDGPRASTSALATLFVPRAVTYGSGLAGTVCTPLLASTCPQLGRTAVVSVERGLGGTVGLLWISAAPLSLPFAGGTLLVGWDVAISIRLGGTGNQPCVGNAMLHFPIPVDPALQDGRLYLQAVLVDVGAPESLSLTQGLEIVLG